MSEVALITGVTGQDGAYPAEFLLGKDDEVHGIKRHSSPSNTSRIDHPYQHPQASNRLLFLRHGDMTDATNLIHIVQETQADGIYRLAAQNHVQVSLETAEYTGNADAIGTLRLLESFTLLGGKDRARLFQVSTSEPCGKVQEEPQSEAAPFCPRSPYAAAKLHADWTHSEAYGCHASNGILFNHESPLKGEAFVTCKVTRGMAAIALGLPDRLSLGHLDAERGWGQPAAKITQFAKLRGSSH